VRAVRDSLRTAARCNGQTITQIDVRPQPPNFGGIFDRSRFLAEMVSVLHMTTRPEVVRRFLLLQEGQPCIELRRAESERILRAQRYLADARISVFPDGDGVRLDVYVVDEASTVLGGSVRGPSPRPTALKLGNANVAGQGIYAAGEWREGFYYRDGYGLQLRHPQVFGRPYQLSVDATRHDIGQEWDVGLSHPFLTDLQRIAWRINAGSTESFVGFLRETGTTPSLSSRRDYADLGGIVRIGVPGQLSLFGISFTRERERSGLLPQVISDTGRYIDTSSFAAFKDRYRNYEGARVNALWGVRNIRFARVSGFDALTGPQDVRVGMQFGTLLGRSLSVIGSSDDDIFVSTDLYAGMGSRKAFAALQVQGEGRQDGNTNRWDGVLAGGRFAWYIKPAVEHTIIASVDYGGGWRQRLPFQLTLRDREGGIRGYHGSQVGGAQRLVGRLEERWMLGRPRALGDAGVALFADAGRLWAGDAPFGVDTRMKTGLGFGLLAAVPPRSRRVYRVDVAFPVSPDPNAKWEVRFTTGDFTRTFWTEPHDLNRGRERTVPTSVFTWP
jgi:hypothetical protein